jgi:arginase
MICDMNIRVILVPYDSGHHRKRMGLGPERFLEQGLAKLFTQMKFPLETVEVALDSPHPAEVSSAFELGRKVAEKVRESRAQGFFPIVLSGNCNASMGTVSGGGAERTGIIWFDAHGEATTPETTTSGFLDGMPISILLGRAWQSLARSVPGFAAISGERIVLFGASQLEQSECELLDQEGVKRFSSVPELEASLAVLRKDVQQLYVHLDLDVLTSTEAVWNHWSGPKGISLLTLLEALAEIGKTGNVCGLGVASYDPAADTSSKAMLAGVRAVQTLLARLPT